MGMGYLTLDYSSNQMTAFISAVSSVRYHPEFPDEKNMQDMYKEIYYTIKQSRQMQHFKLKTFDKHLFYSN